MGTLTARIQIEPFTTLYLTLENPIPQVMRPKFDAMGGDARRFFLLTGITTEAEMGNVIRALSHSATPDSLKSQSERLARS